MNTTSSTPAELARQTLSLLAERKLPPTPENYSSVYAEICGNTTENTGGASQVLDKLVDKMQQTPKLAKSAIEVKQAIAAGSWDLVSEQINKALGEDNAPTPWSNLIQDLLRELEANHKGLTIARKKDGLNLVLTRFGNRPEVLFEKLNNLVRSWTGPIGDPTVDHIIEAPIANHTDAIALTDLADEPAAGSEILDSVSELLAQTLESIAATQPDMTNEVANYAAEVRNLSTSEQVTELAKKLRPFWIRVELRGGNKARVHEGLVHLLRLLLENIGGMVEDEEWLRGQITMLQQIVSNPVDKAVISDAEQNLRFAIARQGALKQSMTDAKSTLKGLVSTFIDRLGEITNSTGDYHQKMEGYSEQIKTSENLPDLSVLLDAIMQDTQDVRSKALRSHQDMLDTQSKAEVAEAKIRALEKELAEISLLVHQDQLTGALNRRGLEESYERESSRCERHNAPLSVALLDIDNFKRLNDSLGHQAGDKALVHLSMIIKEALRPSDSVARFGGEEFVIIFPELNAEEAAKIVERLQRELTKRFFLHGNERVLITFSGGVAELLPNETKDDIIGRADRAMYQAKKAGKNRVVVANENNIAK